MKNLLVTISEKNYLSITKQFLNNVLKKGFWQDDVMLITTESMNENSLKWFYDNEIIVKKYPYYFSKEKWYSMLPDGVKHPIVCSKIYLFNIEFKKWKKILYLDSDTIIRGSLEQMPQIETFGAVRNKNNPFLHRHFEYHNNKNKDLYHKLSSDFNLFSPAFNAGVFCFDTSIISEGLVRKFDSLFNKFSTISTFSEQSILNLMFSEKWEKLPTYYNYDVNRNMIYHNINPKKINAKILHFNGKMKPWDKDSYFYDEWNQKRGEVRLGHEAKRNYEIKFSNKKSLGFELYSILKKITSFKIRFFISYVLANYFPEIYKYIKSVIGKNTDKTIS